MLLSNEEMHSLLFCLSVLIITQNVTFAKKVYVIDLADNDYNEDRIQLNELFKLITKSKETLYEKPMHDEAVKDREPNDEECVDVTLTEIETIKCLQRIQQNKEKNSRNKYHDVNKRNTKRKIYNLYNYYGGFIETQPFKDETRQEFSQDYLDIGDLSRQCDGCNYHQSLKDENHKDSNLKVMRRNTKYEDRSSSESNSFDSIDERKSDDKTSEEEIENVRTNKKRRKPNRFQVVFNDDSSIESVESEKVHSKSPKSFSSESEEAVKSSKSSESEVTEKPKKSRDKLAYLQGNKVYDLRKRLEHFLPKRYHWDEEDMHKLGYYWYDGPKGKYTQN